MIIHVQRTKNVITINRDFASAVPEFAELLNDDDLGVNLMAYVVYVLDPGEDNIWYQLPDEIRKKEVAESLKIEKEKLKDKRVIDALKKYKQFVDSNIGYQFKESYLSGMKKVSEYIKNTNSIDNDTAKKFVDALSEMPSLLKGKTELEKLSSKEEKKAGVVAGKKTLTFNEQTSN